jgi:glycosyltransferase involved in cell wall biosynthesis
MLRQISHIGGVWASDAEVAVSDVMLDRMRRHPHGRRIRRIYNGVDPDTYLPPAGAPTDRGPSLVVGFAGRLVAGKGADHLVRALAQANEQVPIKLLIAGDGPERSRLTSLAQTLGDDSKIEFLGIVDDLPAFWQRCDVAAVPSDALESFSMATLEAMACAKPVVATCTGAIPELIVNGATGTLVAPGDINALSKALVAYAECPDLRDAHGAAARARAIERFHIDDCARAYLDLFGELATSRRKRAY